MYHYEMSQLFSHIAKIFTSHLLYNITLTKLKTSVTRPRSNPTLISAPFQNTQTKYLSVIELHGSKALFLYTDTIR